MAKAWHIKVFRDGKKVHSVTINPGSALWKYAVSQLDGNLVTVENVIKQARNCVEEAFAADESISIEVEE